MIRRVVVLTLLLIAPTAASATSITLTTEQVVQVWNGLSSLDWYEKMIKDGATERVAKVPYVFSGGVRLAIAKDMVALRDTILAFQRVRQTIISHIPKSDGPLSEDTVRQLESAGAVVGTFDLIMLKPADLQMDPPASNPIPPSTITLLAPILDNN